VTEHGSWAIEMPSAGEDASAETAVLEQAAPAVVSTEDATSQVAALQKLLAAHNLDACAPARAFRCFDLVFLERQRSVWHWSSVVL
jgi:hypothetical protein